MSESKPDMVRTRFAPSPSGHLHVGGARTALFCWAFARGRDGRLILRIEDTDRKRSSDAATQAFFEDLKWLGIEWDEGPFFQSQRLEHYHRFADRLIRSGRAYRAFETAQELDAARKAAASRGEAYRYDRAALALDPGTVERYLAEKRPSVVRFKVPDEGKISVPDVVRGQTIVGADQLDDFVIIKADGYPTYHFAVVVDDELMGVTHVIRGQEHLYNTARHVLMQDALGFRRPIYAHVSLIFNPDGSKMSKRDKDKALRRVVTEGKLEGPPPDTMDDEHWRWWQADTDHQLELEAAERLADAVGIELPEIDVEDFRRAGYLPEVMVNYLGLLGWSPGKDVEKFDAKYLIEHFDLDRVIKSPARFDRDKLLAFNLDALQAMPEAAFADRLLAHGKRNHAGFLDRLGTDKLALFAACNHARSKTLEDPYRSCRFLIADDDQIVYEKSKGVRKTLEGGDPPGYAHLEALVGVLGDLGDWTVEGLEASIKQYAHEHAGGKLGKVAQPLRVAVSGGTISPAIFETLVLLGRASTVNRIKRCLSLREETPNLK